MTTEFQKYEKEIPQLASVPKVSSLDTIRRSLEILNYVSNEGQKRAITEIEQFLTKIEQP